MDANPSMLPADIEAVVASHHGGPVSVSGRQGAHVVMSMAVFRDMMGVGSDEDLARSVAALQISLAQAAAGETMSLDEAADKLAQKYGE